MQSISTWSRRELSHSSLSHLTTVLTSANTRFAFSSVSNWSWACSQYFSCLVPMALMAHQDICWGLSSRGIALVTKMFNVSIVRGQFPKAWKQAMIRQLIKRRTSLTCITNALSLCCQLYLVSLSTFSYCSNKQFDQINYRFVT